VRQLRYVRKSSEAAGVWERAVEAEHRRTMWRPIPLHREAAARSTRPCHRRPRSAGRVPGAAGRLRSATGPGRWCPAAGPPARGGDRPTGSCEDALDTACGLYLNGPTAWTW